MSFLDYLSESLQAKATLRIDQFGGYTTRDLQTMVALLFLDGAWADGTFDSEEHTAVLQALEHLFQLTDDETAHLIEVADFLRRERDRVPEFAARICEQFSEAQREVLLEHFLLILEADSIITRSENTELERVLSLLKLSSESVDRVRQAVRSQ
ncbi:MAG: TerB family tellurite resistance protein [Bdellovibrionales bacterium]|nr:TerB family tellurite resistance protein [Bdellovibrionales bacterium]